MSKMLEKKGTLLIIRVPEELDHHTAEEVRTQADHLLTTEQIQKLVFDFSRTVFCDSSGIGMLMGRYKIMKALGGEIQAVHVSENVHRILQMSGVTRLIPIKRD